MATIAPGAVCRCSASERKNMTIGQVSRTIVFSLVCAMASAVLAGETAPPGQVARIKVQPDKAPDCSSLKTIAETVTRDCQSNDAKAIAIYNFMQLSHYHRQY